MNRSHYRLALALGFSMLASLAVLPARTTATPPSNRPQAIARDDNNALTIMTCCGMWAGFNSKAVAGAGIPYGEYYKTLWAHRFPHLKIKEIDVPGYSDMTAKTLLEVNAGNPPDLIGTQGQLGELVARHAVQNLDPYFARAHIRPEMFLPALANWARIKGHWYAIPAASNPSVGDILYIPTFVKAAGWDPNNIPRTWDQLWTATQKVTRRDSKGNLVRIGVEVGGMFNTPDLDQVNLFCGYFATYEQATHRFHANLPCIKNYFRYEKRLLDYYGGIANYTKFISGDPTIWGGYTPKAYVPSGKIVFPIDAYWSGQQMDHYWNVAWRLAPPPTPHGTLAERRAVDVTAQMVEIPVGAKHAQLAFDFALFTLVTNSYVQGPTTNGFTVADQAQRWADVVAKSSQQVRASHHFPGNPMAEAVKLVMQDARLGRVFIPTDVASTDYANYMSRAWQKIAYGRASVDQALDEAQRLTDNKQHALYAQFGM